MPQKRRWNFKDDDATKDLNRWLTGIIPPGLYHGFDFNPTANMNLNLVHTSTGFKDVDDEEAESSFQGLLITRLGVVIKEDDAITINGVAVGDSTNPRIDLVVITHEYVATAGGQTALYSVITGTPAATPVPPALVDAETQIVIGELYIPAGTVALNGAGVYFTRREKPTFAKYDTPTDLNSFKNSGYYQIRNTYTNIPADLFDHSQLIVTRIDNMITQRIVDIYSGEYQRTFSENVWTSWRTTRHCSVTLDIGPWDMNANFSKTVSYSAYFPGSTAYKKIRKITAIIRIDTGFVGLFYIDGVTSGSPSESWGGIGDIGVSTVRLVRFTGEGFDSVNYSDITDDYNRGYVTVEWDQQYQP